MPTTLAVAAVRTWRRWGWPGQLGCLLLVLASLAATFALPLLEDQADVARDAVDEARRADRARRRLPPAEVSRPPGPAEFLATLPDATARPQRVAALWALAARHGLVIGRSEYQLSTEPESGTDRYRITLPVLGSYPALCAFIAAALASDDGLALDALRLSRDSAAAPQLQAELRVSLFGRSGAGGAAGGGAGGGEGRGTGGGTGGGTNGSAAAAADAGPDASPQPPLPRSARPPAATAGPPLAVGMP